MNMKISNGVTIRLINWAAAILHLRRKQSAKQIKEVVPGEDKNYYQNKNNILLCSLNYCAYLELEKCQR